MTTCDTAHEKNTPLFLGAQIEVVVGKDLFLDAVHSFVIPRLVALAPLIELPDMSFARGKIVMRGFQIEHINVVRVEPLPYTPKTVLNSSRHVAAGALEIQADVNASLKLDRLGDEKVSISATGSTLRLHVELIKDAVDTQLQWIVITQLSLLQWRSGTSPTIKFESSALATGDRRTISSQRIVKGVIQASHKQILWTVRAGFNLWGASKKCAEKLRFPLPKLDSIPLGPSGVCVGQIGRRDRCRAYARINIRKLELLHANDVLHIIFSFSPYVLRYPFETVQDLQLQSPVGPIYSGMPIPFASNYKPLRAKITKTYSEALDNCLQFRDECNSVWADYSASGQLQYSLGRSTFPVPDGDDMWEICATEGGVCWSPQSSRAQSFDTTGMEPPRLERYMRVRFGSQEPPHGWLERTTIDKGFGIPCWSGFFKAETNLGARGREGAPRVCLRLMAPSFQQRPDEIRSSGCSGMDCPVERPCALPSHADTELDACVQDEVGPGGLRSCPTPWMHCWANRSLVPFTTPVVLAAKPTRLECVGPNHLACWDDVSEERTAPPSLLREDQLLENMGPASFHASIGIDSLNEGIAAIYSAGIMRKPIVVAKIATLDLLCTASKGFLCLTAEGVSGAAQVRVMVWQKMPSKVAVRDGHLYAAVAVNIGLFIDASGARGRAALQPRRPQVDACIRKAGLLVRRSAGEDQRHEARRGEVKWVELENANLSIFSRNGHWRELSVPMHGVQGYAWEPLASDASCIKLSTPKDGNVLLCAESEGTRREWMDAMKSEDGPCTPGAEADVSIQLSIEIGARIGVAQDQFLCAWPSPNFSFPHVGGLKLSSSVSGAYTLRALSWAGSTANAVTNLFENIVWATGALRPLQMGNLNMLSPGKGLRMANVTMDESRILIDALLDKAIDDTQEDGVRFSMSENNACVRAEDLKYAAQWRDSVGFSYHLVFVISSIAALICMFGCALVCRRRTRRTPHLDASTSSNVLEDSLTMQSSVSNPPPPT